MDQMRKQKILERIEVIGADIAVLQRVTAELDVIGTAHAVLASGGPGKYYTRHHLRTIPSLISTLDNERSKLHDLLKLDAPAGVV